MLADLACVSNSDCWTVGYHEVGYGNHETLVQHWNGADWSVVESPNITPAFSNDLYAVSCSAANDCWAVGAYAISSSSAEQTLTAHWDGASWSIVPSPSVANARSVLSDLICVGSNACWAVGYSQDLNTGTAQTLIERWDGSAWLIAASANGLGSTSYLTSVACISATDCWAVGVSFNNGVSQTLTEHWNGSSWSAVPSLSTSPAQPNELRQITCSSSSDCWAVGDYRNGGFDQTLIEHWNGVTWAIAPSPNATNQENILYGVSCTAANDCSAVGFYEAADNYFQTLVEHWDGLTWSIVSSPSVEQEMNFLASVACAPDTGCWSVGAARRTHNQTLVQRLEENGWSIVVSPNINQRQLSNDLAAVACASGSDCWAAGAYIVQPDGDGSEASQAAVAHWNGSDWRYVDLSAQGIPNQTVLYKISCVNGADCWAVGANRNGTLTLHWDGSLWSVVSSPNVDDPTRGLNGILTTVTCISASDCWAAGTFESNTGSLPLVEHWDGNAWSIAVNPELGSGYSQVLLNDIACSSSTNCFTTGSGHPPDGYQRTLILHWNGMSWSVVPSPNPAAGAGTNSLSGITCGSANDCWSVGGYTDLTDGTSGVLIERWNGVAWSIVPPDPASGPNDGLAGVTCLSPSNCFAVGSTPTGTLIQQWEGSSWKIVPSENTAAQANSLTGIACVTGAYCWAVGSISDGITPQTLIEGRTLSDVVPTPTPTPSASPSPTPVVSVSVSPGQINEGSDATFTISASPNTARPVTVFYSMGGKASSGIDYTLGGTAGQVTVPVGQDSATVALHALSDSVKEKNEPATMTLSANSSYSFGGAPGKKKKKVKAPSASVTITNVGP